MSLTLVCSTTGGAGTEAAPAELALGLLLAAARAIPAADANIRAGRFQEGVPVGISLAGKTIGIIGLGRLGSAMAGFCRALDMRVLAWSENLTEEKAQAAGAALVSKEDLLSRSDAISIHMVLSSRSRGLIGASDIACLGMAHGGTRLVFRATQFFVGRIGAGSPAPDFIAKDLMAVHAGIGDIAADVADFLLVSGLGCAVRGSSHFRHFFGESNPIRIVHRDRLAVFTTTPCRQHQGRRLN